MQTEKEEEEEAMDYVRELIINSLQELVLSENRYGVLRGELLCFKQTFIINTYISLCSCRVPWIVSLCAS